MALVTALSALGASSLAAETARVMPPQQVTRHVVAAPKPEYPDAAKQRHQHGTGVFLLRTKIATGVVTEVITAQSTNYALLDDAAVKALRQWRFKPGALVHRDIYKPQLKRPIAKDECLVLVPVAF